MGSNEGKYDFVSKATGLYKINEDIQNMNEDNKIMKANLVVSKSNLTTLRADMKQAEDDKNQCDAFINIEKQIEENNGEILLIIRR